MDFEIEAVQFTPNWDGVIVQCRNLATTGPLRGTLQMIDLRQRDLPAAWGDEDVRAAALAYLAQYFTGATLRLRPVGTTP